MKALLLLGFALAGLAAPAFGNVTVSAPGNGASVVSPFALAAVATPCSSQSISAMGYSIDNSRTTTIVYNTSLQVRMTAATGSHILHVKSWGNRGASCVADVAITVVKPAGLVIPRSAVAVTGIHAMSSWKADYDTATGNGTASGAMSIVTSPSVSGTARQFLTSYTNYGGERYYINFGHDTAATNFVYDGWLYVASPANDIANIEMDMNQVMSNGQTVIFGFQCDGWSNTWDYTANTGTPQAPVDKWLHSTAQCNPRSWSTNAWHHVQISYSRDNAGNVTYKSVWLDGGEQDINATVSSAFALGWAPALLTNFQVDGIGTSGSANVFLDNLTIYRW